MADTFSKIHIHIVFSVKERTCLISSFWKDQLYAYITGIIQNYGHKVLAINGVGDHIHILVGFRPNQSLSELMKFVKRDSTIWINKKQFVRGKFAWQEGYGAFSYSYSHINSVIDYIKNQEKHHSRKTFREEYLKLLELYNIEHENKKLFEWINEEQAISSSKEG